MITNIIVKNVKSLKENVEVLSTGSGAEIEEWEISRDKDGSTILSPV